MSENMLFCLGDGKYESSGEGYQKNYRIFNKDVSREVFEKVKSSEPSFELPVAKWIDKKDMSEQEKKDDKIYTEIGGYLRVLSYEDAWAEALPKHPEFAKWVLSLPNFDAKLFKEITGQKITNEISLKGKEVEVKLDGKTYKAIITE